MGRASPPNFREEIAARRFGGGGLKGGGGGARRFGGDELKWRPALLQCLLGLQCQSRPSAAYVQKNGLQSRIWRMRHHPLTVSGPKPTFKWSKHACPQKRRAERPDNHRSGLARRHTPHATLSHILD